MSADEIPTIETADGTIKLGQFLKLANLAESGSHARELIVGGDVKVDETFVMRSKVLMDLRAAGSPNPVSGMWADIKDLSGLTAFAEQNRSIGYEGMLCIHPPHVPVINKAFTPTAADLERDWQLVEMMTKSVEAGHGATVFNGEMIDEAMAVTARRRLDRYGFAVPAPTTGTVKESR